MYYLIRSVSVISGYFLLFSNGCNTEFCDCVSFQSNQSQIIYKNTIMAHDPASDSITRNNLVNLDFSCIYDQPQTSAMSFKIEDR